METGIGGYRENVFRGYKLGRRVDVCLGDGGFGDIICYFNIIIYIFNGELEILILVFSG